jgi:hypothetical protein
MLADRTHVLIISGGYGLVCADEPISDYDLIFQAPRWPQRLIPRCLEAYCDTHAIKTVAAFAGRTTPYAQVIRQSYWRHAGVQNAALICPSFSGGGALQAVPKAIGQAVLAFANAQLHTEWRTPPGLKMTWKELV